MSLICPSEREAMKVSASGEELTQVPHQLFGL